jgi:hypothetical protein
MAIGIVGDAGVRAIGQQSKVIILNYFIYSIVIISFHIKIYIFFNIFVNQMIYLLFFYFI